MKKQSKAATEKHSFDEKLFYSLIIFLAFIFPVVSVVVTIMIANGPSK